MLCRLSGIGDQLGKFVNGLSYCLWDTVVLVWEILLDLLAKMIELIIAVMNIVVQVICFLRNLCIEAIQTFANVFHGLVNVVGAISGDDVEDFASACIVVLLWVGAVKVVLNMLCKKNLASADCVPEIREPEKTSFPGCFNQVPNEYQNPRKSSRKKKTHRKYTKRRTTTKTDEDADEDGRD